MIQLTKNEETVYLSFQKMGSLSGVCEDTKLSLDTVRMHLASLCELELMTRQKHKKGYVYEVLGGEYEVIGITNEVKHAPMPRLGEMIIKPEEAKWMEENYSKYRRNRSKAAQMLGKTRTEICNMAMQLGLDVEGIFRAKSNKSRSA